MYNRNKNINILIDLERMKGESINNISQYNHALQRQVIYNQQRMHILKYKNDNQKSSSLILNVQKNYCSNCD